MFKSSKIVGVQEFQAAWGKALIEEVTFDYSGYVIGNYLDAQEHVNSHPNTHEHTETALALTKAFTAAFPFEQEEKYAEFSQDRLATWCREEYGKDLPAMVEALNAAHAFYQQGLAKIDDEAVVVFLIQ